ncbi:MAG TPA: hypothetical protein VJO53_00140 [Candidatus Acidoferrales bacterium]|nr:hypothetical protein [Candidatus Acidoferrales bacterium]
MRRSRRKEATDLYATTGTPLGRWLSADWSAVPAPVPYANLTNPQTLNLYAMVSDNPETFADLDGHGDANDATSACSGNAHQNCSDPPPQPPPQAPPQPPPPAQPPPQGPQPPVAITFDKNVPPMSPETKNYVTDVLAASGVSSANISATTNGEHSPNSWHPDGQAVDINQLNGAPVRTANTDPKMEAATDMVQHTANNPSIGVAHENYGPAGLYKDGKQLNGQQGKFVGLQNEHENHIHLTIPNPRRANDP